MMHSVTQQVCTWSQFVASVFSSAASFDAFGKRRNRPLALLSFAQSTPCTSYVQLVKKTISMDFLIRWCFYIDWLLSWNTIQPTKDSVTSPLIHRLPEALPISFPKCFVKSASDEIGRQFHWLVCCLLIFPNWRVQDKHYVTMLLLLSIQASLVWMNIPAQKKRRWSSCLYDLLLWGKEGDWSEAYKSSSHQKPGGLLLVGPVPYAPAWLWHLGHLMDSPLLFSEIISSSITK